MLQPWLFPNRNVFLAAAAMLTPPFLLSLVVTVWALNGQQYWLAGMMGIIAAGALYGLLGCIGAIYRPRLAYKEPELLVYLERGQPVRVPIQIVECFFLGQGPSQLPKIEGKEAETKNVIVRLAESATEWKHRDVPERWGHWCEGYITINGAWCEPISNDRLAELNRFLIAAQRKLRETAKERT